MSFSEKLLLLAGGIFITTLLILLWRGRGRITPFHVAVFFFAPECILALWPQLVNDPYGRTKYWEVMPEVAFALVGVATLILALSFYLRFDSLDAPRKVVHADFRINENLIFGFALGLSILSTATSLARLGTFPLFALSAAAVQEQIGYAQVFQGFTTHIAWGSTRMMAVMLGVLMIFSGSSWSEFVRSKRWLLTMFGVALLLNLLDGQRSLLIYPLFVLLFAISIRQPISLRRILAVGCAMVLFFITVGTIRAKHVTEQRLARPTGNDVLDDGVGWIVTYLEPNIYNLNNLLQMPPRRTYGLLLVSQIVPDRLLEETVEIPPTVPEYMSDQHLFAQPGLTFRTILADFVPDFGLAGAFFTSSLIFLLCCVAQRSSRESPILAYVYLVLSIGVAAAPFHNLLVGINGVAPWLGLLLLRVRPAGRHLNVS